MACSMPSERGYACGRARWRCIMSGATAPRGQRAGQAQPPMPRGGTSLPHASAARRAGPATNVCHTVFGPLLRVAAISRRMTRELDHAFKRAERDTAVKVILVRSEGAHFSSGHDLGSDLELGDKSLPHQIDPRPRGDYAKWYDMDVEMALAWRNLRKPLIAAVQGCVQDVQPHTHTTHTTHTTHKRSPSPALRSAAFGGVQRSRPGGVAARMVRCPPQSGAGRLCLCVWLMPERGSPRCNPLLGTAYTTGRCSRAAPTWSLPQATSGVPPHL